MKSIYLTDKDFSSLDNKLNHIEGKINRILLKPIINNHELNAQLFKLEFIKVKLMNTMEFSKNEAI